MLGEGFSYCARLMKDVDEFVVMPNHVYGIIFIEHVE
jgi:REP element-mobilizing transposase RayT